MMRNRNVFGLVLGNPLHGTQFLGQNHSQPGSVCLAGFSGVVSHMPVSREFAPPLVRDADYSVKWISAAWISASFTSPKEKCIWQDILTHRESVSLGAQCYREILQAEGLILVGEMSDEGTNHYYSVRKP
jgi:hypothetical protein